MHAPSCSSAIDIVSASSLAIQNKMKQQSDPFLPGSYRARTLPAKCSMVSVNGDEDLQRIFHTRRDPRRVRTLKSLRLLKRTPSSVTYAETGVQVTLPTRPTLPEEVVEALKHQIETVSDLSDQNYEDTNSSRQVLTELEVLLNDLTGRLELFERDLAKAEGSNSQFKEQLSEKDQGLERLWAECRNTTRQLSDCRSQLAQRQGEVETLLKDKSRLLTTVGDLQLETERLELDVAFLTEEKVDLESSLTEHKSLLDLVSQEKDEFQSKEENLKTALLQTKVNSAEQVGKYLDELNAVWTEKRNFIQNKLAGQPMSKELKKVLTNTERLLELEEERNRLVDQVELLSSQTVFQDLLVEQFQARLLRLMRILDGTESGALRDKLLTDELVKARKLIDRESSIFNIMGKVHKTKGRRHRLSASLPSSPLSTNKDWAKGDIHHQKSPKVKSGHPKYDSEQPGGDENGGQKENEKKGKSRRKLEADPEYYQRRKSLPPGSPQKAHRGTIPE